LLAFSPADGWSRVPAWQTQVRKYAEARDWNSAMRLVEQEIARAPQDMDVRAWRARVLAWSGKLPEAEKEYLAILQVSRTDPENTEARDGLISVRRGTQQELRFGQDNDLLSYSADFHDEFVSVVSQWSSHWTTSVAGNFYQRAGVAAGKCTGSITRRQPKWGALTAGGAVGHDNAVIPKSEAFFDVDRGWKTGELSFVRGVEFDYAQHWYWYQSARILALNGTAVLYFPEEWTFSVVATGARSAFTGTGAEWKPSGIGRLGFPLARWGERRLSGNLFFAAGTENFAIVDQIGSFASQTYGGGLRYQIATRQDVTSFVGYQKRTQN